MPIILSGSDGVTTFSQTGSVGTVKQNFLHVRQNITLDVTSSGAKVLLYGHINENITNYTCSLPTPTASIEGTWYQFVVAENVMNGGLQSHVVLSASRDPLGAPNGEWQPGLGQSATQGTGSFVGSVLWAAAAGDADMTALGQQNNGYTLTSGEHSIIGHNLIRLRKGSQGDGAQVGDTLTATCVKYGLLDDDLDFNACYWLVSGHFLTASAMTGSDAVGDLGTPWE